MSRARDSYLLDCKAMDDLWQAYCGTDWEPNDDSAGERPKQIAAEVQDRMQRAMQPLLETYYAEKHRRGEAPDDDKGGATFMKALVAHCMRDGEVTLKAKVGLYNMCDKPYVCESN